MEKYISKKVKHAEPMSSDKWQEIRSGFEKYSDATLEPGIAGYHVVYDLGKETEYHSWSPKSIFDAGNILSTSDEYGINLNEDHIDIILGDGMTGLQALAYDEQEDGKYGMAGIVICRDGERDKPFGTNEGGKLYSSNAKKVFIRADTAKSLQRFIDQLEIAKGDLV